MSKPALKNINFVESAVPLEKQILATLLDIPAQLNGVVEILEAEDFFSDAGRQIFAWIRAQSNSSQDISAALAQSRFAGVPAVEAYLLDLLLEMPSSTTLISHAEGLRELAVRRDTIESLQSNIPALLNREVAIDGALNMITEGMQRNNNRLNASQSSVMTYGEVGLKWLDNFKTVVESGASSGIPTGFHELDDALAGLQPADIIIIGGRPSMGKTTFAMNIIENISIVQGKPALVFSLEMPSVSIYQRSIASVGGIDFDDLRKGKLQKGDVEKLQIATEKLNAAPILIDDTAGLNLNQLASRAIRAKKEHDIGVIMIDYLQLMTLSEHLRTNRNEGVGEISRGLKQLAKLLNIPIVVLSQLSRELEKRANKRPIPADLRDSGSIEQDADVIMFVYRDEVYNAESQDKGIAEIIIGKQRNGPLATVKLDFGGAQSNFRNRTGNCSSTLAQAKTRGGVTKLSSVKGLNQFEVTDDIPFN